MKLNYENSLSQWEITVNTSCMVWARSYGIPAHISHQAQMKFHISRSYRVKLNIWSVLSLLPGMMSKLNRENSQQKARERSSYKHINKVHYQRFTCISLIYVVSQNILLISSLHETYTWWVWITNNWESTYINWFQEFILFQHYA